MLSIKNFSISFITYIEFLGYKHATQSTIDFIALATVVETNKSIIDTCIMLRKNYIIKLPDAIIAATALASNYSLITNNEKDFAPIKELDTINLYKI